MKSNWIRAGLIGLVAFVGLSAVPSAQADQEFGWTHTWLYISGPKFDDFHATYAGTGGTIDRTVLTIDDAGGGMISANMNMIDISWPPGTWVEAGDSFQYTFNTAFSPIDFVGGTITKSGGVIGIVEASGIVRDPQQGQTIGFFEHSLVPAPGTLALVIVAGVITRRRRVA